MVKIKILKSHLRAEDCRTVHSFTVGQIIDASEEFAQEILKDQDGVIFTADAKIEERKAIIEAPENKMIEGSDLENKTFPAEEISEKIITPKTNSKKGKK